MRLDRCEVRLSFGGLAELAKETMELLSDTIDGDLGCDNNARVLKRPSSVGTRIEFRREEEAARTST